MNLNKLKISTRLSFGFGLLAVMIAALGVMAVVKADNMDSNVQSIIKSRVPVLSDLAAIKDEMNLQARSLRNMLLVTKSEDVKGERERIAESGKRATDLYAHLEPLIVMEQGKAMLAAMKESRAEFRTVSASVMTLADQGKKDQAVTTLLTTLHLVQDKYFGLAQQMTDLQTGFVAKAGAEAAASASDLKLAVWVTGGAALLAAALLAFWTIRSITRQLGAEPTDAADVARGVAEGDLRVQIELRRGDTTSVMAQLKLMQESLSSVVLNVRQNSESVATASAEIAQGNNDLSSRTEQQASALEETAASMEELSSTVKQNADNARQANQLALSATTVAVKGGEVVSQVVSTMKGINDSSKKIADIISVIDGIAFQTNILALNAAVEAARAGEQGRGFAVVASEVRSLAGRSADAAKEIKALISASVERVEQGTALVDQAGATMTEVVSSIRRVTDIMGEISAASSEQSAGVAQIGQAVTQMDQATQQNAALVEESAAAAESLKVQAQQLVQTVAVFTLARRPGSAAPAAAAPAKAPFKAPPPRHVAPARASAAPAEVERRSPNRAKNVVRPAFGATAAGHAEAATASTASTPAESTGSDDWTSF